MYLRKCYRAKDGKRHAYWALVKSVRTAKGPRQEVVAYLGDLDEAGRLGVQQAADGDRSAGQAHVLVCFLAYVLWKTLSQLCKSAGLGDEPRKVLDEIAAIQTVDVILPTRCGQRIRKRCVGKPSEHQAILLHKLGMKLPRSLEVVEL